MQKRRLINFAIDWVKMAWKGRDESFVMIKTLFYKKKKKGKERNGREMTFRNYFERNLRCKRLIECSSGTILMHSLRASRASQFREFSENWIFHQKKKKKKKEKAPRGSSNECTKESEKQCPASAPVTDRFDRNELTRKLTVFLILEISTFY